MMENIEDMENIEGIETDAVDAYLGELIVERDNLEKETFTHAFDLLSKEINRIQAGGPLVAEETERKPIVQELRDIHLTDKWVKVSEKVRIPIQEHPKFNFVGKLLGPKGKSLQRIQDVTGTKIAILGRGSFKDKDKEEQLRREGGEKNSHLNEELHLMVEAYAPVDRCFTAIGHAFLELQPYLHADPADAISQSQMTELGWEPPVFRGGGGHGSRGGHGGSRGSSSSSSYGRGRGRSERTERGGGSASSGRRGSSQGVRSARGLSRGSGRGRPAATAAPTSASYQREEYASYQDPSYASAYDYGEEYVDTGNNNGTYYDYGHGGSSSHSYADDYGVDSWGSSSHLKSAAPRSSRGARSHPYGY